MIVERERERERERDRERERRERERKRERENLFQVSRRTFSSPCNDPRSLLTQAQTQYQNNNIRAAYEYTKIIMKEYGNYRVR